MSKIQITAFATLIMMVMAIGTTIIVLNSTAVAAQVGPNYTPVGDSEIRTVEHDDHKFVLLLTDSGQGISIIHHPGCKCLK